MMTFYNLIGMSHSYKPYIQRGRPLSFLFMQEKDGVYEKTTFWIIDRCKHTHTHCK